MAMFLACLDRNKTVALNPVELGEFISSFEWLRNGNKSNFSLGLTNDEVIILNLFEEQLLNLFNDRASSRAANVSSVVTRDLIIWVFYSKFSRYVFEYLSEEKFGPINEIVPSSEWSGSELEVRYMIEDFISEHNWGLVYEIG